MRCLDSIPVREDIQVLVIDDCSPGSDNYLEKYPALSRPFLEFYRTPAGGSAGRARNIGLDHAKGKWIICMDADDFFVDNMEEILDAARDRTEDILFHNYIPVKNSDLSTPGKRDWYRKYFKEYETDGDERWFRYRFESLAGKIFRHGLIQEHGIRFDETRYSNDVAFSFKCGTYAKTIAVIDKDLFVVTEREGSLAASQFTDHKASPEEYRTRLGVMLDVCRFKDSKRIRIDLIPRKYSFSFFLDWPREFLRYYFSEIVPHFPRYALPILCYVAWKYFRRKLVGFYHLFKH